MGHPTVRDREPGQALDRNEIGALLVAAGLGPPLEHLGLERGHRTPTITRIRAARS